MFRTRHKVVSAADRYPEGGDKPDHSRSVRPRCSPPTVMIVPPQETHAGEHARRDAALVHPHRSRRTGPFRRKQVGHARRHCGARHTRMCVRSPAPALPLRSRPSRPERATANANRRHMSGSACIVFICPYLETGSCAFFTLRPATANQVARKARQAGFTAFPDPR